MEFTGCVNDDAFGPAIQGCRGDFDFTIRFEKIVLSLIPACVFIALSIPRAVYLVQRPQIVRSVWFQVVKLVIASIFAAIQLAILVLSSHSNEFRALLASSAALALTASLCIVCLSFLEHSRSPRPSILLNAYLFLTLLFDIAQVRTLWLASMNSTVVALCRVSTASVVLKAFLLLLESQHKTRWIQWVNKEHSPEETTGIFGLGAYLWLNRLFWTGYREVLSLDDLYSLDGSMDTETLSLRLENHIEAATSKGRRFGLTWALGKTLWVSLILPIGPRLALTAFKFCQPFLINTLLTYLQQNPDDTSRNPGYGLIGATILIYTGIAVSTALYWYFHERTLAMSRGCIAGAIYRKTTKLKLSAASDAAAVTLMSTDVERIRMGFLNVHEFWANTIEVGIASWLLYLQLGAAFVAPLAVVLFCLLLGGFLNKFTGQRTKAWMDKIQTRVGLTANVISNMKHLKLSGLATPVKVLIQKMRVDELLKASKYRRIHISIVTLGITPTALCPVMTFAVTSKSLDVSTIFTSMSYLLLLADPLTYLFQNAPLLVTALACLDRIQEFLEQDPRVDFRSTTLKISDAASEAHFSGDLGSEKESASAVRIRNGNFGWEEGKYSLKNLNFDIPHSRLTVVIGPVASGKSTLCKVLLGEVPIHQAKVSLNPTAVSSRVGYCDQVPYLSSGSIRDNITCLAPFIENRYREVIEATVLKPDLDTFVKGDATEVGSNGIKLSGGQKQRISIARALYLDTNFFIFDDILSGLDADTEEQVFRRVFGVGGLLQRRSATVVLCTHTVRHLPSANHIIALGTNGTIVEQGTFQHLMANKSYVHSLDIRPFEDGRSEDSITLLETDAVRPTEPHNESITQPVGYEHVNDRDRMMGGTAAYSHYLGSFGKTSIAAMLILGLLYGCFYNIGTIWLKIWSQDVSSGNPLRSNSFYIGLYALFQICFVVSHFFDFLVAYTTMIQTSGSRLHESALETVVSAPLKFFTSTETGVITNLFSQDMTLVDNELPVALCNFVMDSCNALGMAAVIATSSPYLAITYPVIFTVLYFIQKFHLRTSRQLRLLDLEAKSPLYSHFLDTIKGVVTFRAFGWVQMGIDTNYKLLDRSQRPYYLLYIVQRWLLFALQIVVAILAVVVVSLATQLRSNTAFTGASLITLMTFGDVLNYIIRWWTQLETSIGAVSRLKNFSEKVKAEDLDGDDTLPPPGWPLKGSIYIDGVSASYDDLNSSQNVPSENTGICEAPPTLALKDLNLTIDAGEKVAICGRSGSGKSTTIALLLRLIDPLPSCSQNITVDDIPLHDINRTALRERIIAVPQEAVFLPDGTPFMANLDPFGASNEVECRSVLEVVGLWPFVESKGGLSGGLVAHNLSQGLKQLFSLARAILRRRVRAREQQALFGAQSMASEGKHVGSGILLLDEVSSSVDQDTDRDMQRIISEEFKEYTVVMVSHRLEMVMNFDTVVMMDKGRVVEKGRPRELVEKEGTWFRELCRVRNGN
ncbi:ATPase-like protein [Xylariales sp. AK1849]|nr:ATPase-like protein [Xylariales sp. AK1849]